MLKGDLPMLDPKDVELTPEVIQQLRDFKDAITLEKYDGQQEIREVKARFKSMPIEELRKLYISRLSVNILYRVKLIETEIILQQYEPEVDRQFDITMHTGANEKTKHDLAAFQDANFYYSKREVFHMWKEQVKLTPIICQNLLDLQMVKACYDCRKKDT